MVPVRVSPDTPMRAMPKSATFTRPSGSTSTLDEVTSRCTTCRSCAACRAASTARAVLAADSGARAPSRLMRSLRVSPGTYSMAMYQGGPSAARS